MKIWERKHIEEWVRENPEILGEDLLVLTIEFDRFVNSDDRLDLLALDRKGNLVVVELKRDPAAGYADLQAIRYAAMVSSMTIDKLVPYYKRYRNKYYEEGLSTEEQLSAIEAKNQIMEFIDSEEFEEISSKPRIILCSKGFSPEITTTVLWLRTEFKIDISCVTITPYRVGEKIIIVPKILLPLEEAKQYLIAIKEKEEKVEQSAHKNQPRTMRLLIENHLVNAGDVIYLKNRLPSWVHYVEDDPTFQAIITGKLGQQDAVQWKKDGLEYSVSALGAKIFKELHPENEDQRSVNGTVNWVNSRGQSLGDLAEQFLAKPQST